MQLNQHYRYTQQNSAIVDLKFVDFTVENVNVRIMDNVVLHTYILYIPRNSTESLTCNKNRIRDAHSTGVDLEFW